MTKIASNMHLFIAGRTGSGKTVWIRSLIPQLPRVIFHDRKHTNTDLMHVYHFSLAKTPQDLIVGLNRGLRRILYQPADGTVDDYAEVCDILFHTGNLTLITDESSELMTTGKEPHYALEILRLGREKGIGFWALAQRPRGISNTVMSECSIIVSFRMNMKTDREKIGSICGDEVRDKLATLPPYHYMMWDGTKIEDPVSWHRPIPRNR